MKTLTSHSQPHNTHFGDFARYRENRDLATPASGLMRCAAARHAARACSRVRRARPDVGTTQPCTCTTSTRVRKSRFSAGGARRWVRVGQGQKMKLPGNAPIMSGVWMGVAHDQERAPYDVGKQSSALHRAQRCSAFCREPARAREIIGLDTSHHCASKTHCVSAQGEGWRLVRVPMTQPAALATIVTMDSDEPHEHPTTRATI